MNFLGIDPAINNIGVTVIDDKGGHIEGALIKNLDKSGYEIIENTQIAISALIQKHKPALIAREDIVYGGYASRGVDRSSDLAYMVGIIDSMCGSLGYTDNQMNLIKVPNKTWQKYVWGKAGLYNKTKNANAYAAGMSQILGRLYAKAELDMADSHAVAIVGKDSYLLRNDLLNVFELTDAQIEAMLSNPCCTAANTGKPTVRKRIRDTGNIELFHAFACFQAPQYAKPYRIDLVSKNTAFGYAYSHKVQNYINKKRKGFNQSINEDDIEQTLNLIFEMKITKNLHQLNRRDLRILI